MNFAPTKYRWQLPVIIAWMLIPGMLLAGDGNPFSIASMTLHDKALAGAHDVELSGDIAFVPGKGQSLSIIDISNPEKPEILWFKHDEEIPDSETVLPVGDYLLLGTKDFLTLNVRDPRNPVILKKISDRPKIDRINGMIKVGNIAIAANKSGYIDAFDVTDLNNPTLFGVLETRKQFDLQKPHDIDRYRDHIVIVDSVGFVPPEGRLGIFRVMKDGKVLPLDQWTLTGKVAGGELIGANRVQVTGDYAIVGGSYSAEGRTQAEKARGAKVTGNMAVVNISDPAKPAIVAAVPFSDVRGPNGLTIAGKVVFCAGRQSVDAYDISDPEKPAHLAGQHFPRYKKDAKRTDNYHDLIYRDGYLYISAQTDNGFLVLRVNDKRIRKLADLK